MVALQLSGICPTSNRSQESVDVMTKIKHYLESQKSAKDAGKPDNFGGFGTPQGEDIIADEQVDVEERVN
eukprot:CAMPEP_0170488988 /NCGR_PEP_ID=MMETSP0208-20121228/7418_1 /TAXON_ID=197538 /ORGANISM="Strombidium inclinatum, Strain S3" /LENGTH=69 /DNA_ID=CAMNT_0010763731 /DNA_START=739 /DNA_END=948 /DNA_ORIENTATION=-